VSARRTEYTPDSVRFSTLIPRLPTVGSASLHCRLVGPVYVRTLEGVIGPLLHPSRQNVELSHLIGVKKSEIINGKMK